MRKLFTRSDIIIIVGILLLSFLLFVPNLLKNDELIAQVYVDGKLAEEINLSEVKEDYSFSPKKDVTVSVKKGAISFSSSPCKDELCVNSGWLSSKGQTAACLPQKVVLTIKGTDKTDMITY